jgi:hypothetical protein
LSLSLLGFAEEAQTCPCKYAGTASVAISDKAASNFCVFLLPEFYDSHQVISHTVLTCAVINGVVSVEHALPGISLLMNRNMKALQRKHIKVHHNTFSYQAPDF